MSSGVLLDTHVLLWLDEGRRLKADGQFEITVAQTRGRLFASHITLWELGVAQHKKSFERRPKLRGLPIGEWFDAATRSFGIAILPISASAAIEAAEVPGVYGSGDPGDSFLIATARIHGLSLATRDAKIISLAQEKTEYISVVVC